MKPMKTKSPMWRRYLTFWGRNIDRDLNDEFGFHLEMRRQEFMDSGLPPEPALKAAKRVFGDAELLRNECRLIDRQQEQIVRRTHYFEQFKQDCVYGLRQIYRRPGLALLTVLTLALGIGANAAVFSVVNGVVLSPLPYDDPDRLVMIWTHDIPQNRPEGQLSLPDFNDLKERSRSIEDMSAVIGFEWDAILEGDPEPRKITVQHVSAPFFSLLGIDAMLGRTLGPVDERPDSSPAVVISERLWQSRFGRDPAVIDREVVIDGEAATVVGVMGREFRFFDDADFWAPIVRNPLAAQNRRSLRWLWAVGRLAPGVSADQADTELDAITADLELEYPDSNTGKRARVVPIHEHLVGNARTTLLVLLGAVGFILLIACANVASLLLGRASSRTREMAIRNAMGANRGRVIRQLLTENVVLAGLGGFAGLLVAYGGVFLLQRMNPDWLPRMENVAVDGKVLLFTATVSLLAGLLFSAAPALQASRAAIALSLAGRTGAEVGQRGQRIRDVLVIAEVGIALMLMVGAGLLVRSFVTLVQVDIGFESAHTLTAELELPATRYAEDADRLSFYRVLLDQAAGMPEAETVALTSDLPLRGSMTTTLEVESRPRPRSEHPELVFQRISTDYFRAMGIPLLEGRTFSLEDANDESPAAIVNQAAAQILWNDDDVLNERFRWSGASADFPWFRVVGVVGNVRHQGPDQMPPPKVYFSLEADVPGGVWLVVRTRTSPVAATASLKEAVRRADANVVVDSLAPMDMWISDSLSLPRFNMLVIGGFALLALLLAMIGMYGIVSYSVAERTHELGVRVALGAGGGSILGLVLGRGLLLGVAGIGAGVIGALALTRYMESLLFGIRPTDPATYLAVSALLLATALVAAYIPARRALHVDPIQTLRDH